MIDDAVAEMPQRRDLRRRGAARHDDPVSAMPTFRYRALTQVGEVVSGSLVAATAAEVGAADRISRPHPDRVDRRGKRRADPTARRFRAVLATERPRTSRSSPAISPCCCAPAPASTKRWSCWPPTPTSAGCARPSAKVTRGDPWRRELRRRDRPASRRCFRRSMSRWRGSARRPAISCRSSRRWAWSAQRAEALRRRLADALRYPAFLLLAAGGVLLFFLLFVLPQFANVFSDFNAKLDPVAGHASSAFRTCCAHNVDAIGVGLAGVLALGVAAGAPARRCARRRAMRLARLPLVRAGARAIGAPRCSAAISACCSRAA